MKILPPSLSPERVKVDDFYAARSGLIPPLPWSTFSPPFSDAEIIREHAPKEANLNLHRMFMLVTDLGQIARSEHPGGMEVNDQTTRE